FADRTLARTSTGAAPYVEEALRWLPGPDLELPIAAAGEHAAAADGSGIRPRVLIADDNADMREYLARILGHHYRVEVAADGHAALDRIRADAPDLVLSDVMMPNLDGFGLLGAIRGDEDTRSLPIVLLSARAGEDARIQGLHAGA